MIASIRRRRTFAELRERGHRVSHGAVRLTYLDHVATDIPMESTPQVAYALGRGFGSAVERNRARRRLRDAFTSSWDHHLENTTPTLRLDGAFLLSGSRSLLTAPFTQLVDDVSACLSRLVDAEADRPSESMS